MRLARSFVAVCAALSCLFPGTAFGEPVTIEASGAEVRALLMGVARSAHLNLIIDDAVSGKVSLRLRAEPEEALRQIAAARGLALVHEGEVYRVTLPASGRSFYTYALSYASPEEVAETARMSILGESEESASAVRADAVTGSLILYGTPGEAAAIERLLKELDRAPSQVALEAKIVALSKDAAKDLGVEWAWKSYQRPRDRSRRYYGDTGSYSDDSYYETYSYNEVGSPDAGAVRFGIGPGSVKFNTYFDAQVSALVSSGKAKMLSRPNIMTVQGRKAQIKIGGEVPVPRYATSDGVTTTSVEYREAGIILSYTPRVNPETKEITAAVHTEVSSPVFVDDVKAYRFQTRSADTEVRLRDGETMVIGGLIGVDESRRLSKVPFLGDLPILGSFFRHVSRSKTESELMIFLTAHVVEDGSPFFEGEPQEK